MATGEAVELDSGFAVAKQSSTFREKALLKKMALFAAGCMAVHT